MAIVQSINTVYQFREAFRLAGRTDQFSYEGLEVLFDYLEQLSEDIGEPIELDVVALCCEYYELSFDEIVEIYNLDLSECDDGNDALQDVRDWLNHRTSVCGEVDGGVVYAAF